MLWAAGSFEANPVFVAAVVVRMIRHIVGLLTDTNLPLSFIVILPSKLASDVKRGRWSGMAAQASAAASVVSPLNSAMTSSMALSSPPLPSPPPPQPSPSFLQHAVRIPKECHSYARGDQHQWGRGRSQLRAARVDTTVLFFQNAAGAARWPTDASVKAELRAAFGAQEHD